MITALQSAFEDNASPAAPLDCTGTEATVVISFPPLSMVPERKLATTPSGAPTLHMRSKTERNTLYVQALSSTVLATVKETLAVAPSLNRVTVLVVRVDPAASSPESYLAAIYVGQLTRARLARLDWRGVYPLAEMLLLPGAMLHRRGQAGEVMPLDLTDEPELDAVVRRLRGHTWHESDDQPAKEGSTARFQRIVNAPDEDGAEIRVHNYRDGHQVGFCRARKGSHTYIFATRYPGGQTLHEFDNQPAKTSSTARFQRIVNAPDEDGTETRVHNYPDGHQIGFIRARQGSHTHVSATRFPGEQILHEFES